MPGVVIKTAVRSGPSGEGDLEVGQYFVAGECERGRITEPTIVRSFSEFVAEYGDYESGSLWPHVKLYFEEGGSRAYVYRITGTNASAGSLDLDDSGATPTMRITAANPGDWSANLSVSVDTPDVAGFKISVYLNSVLQLQTRDLVDVTDAVSVLNNSAVNHLIVASDLGGSSNNPDTLTSTALGAGSDGDAIVDAGAVTALENFGSELGAGAVALPGRTGTTVWDGLRDHAAANNRIALCAFGENDSAATVKTAASAYYGDADAKSMAFYYPFLQIEDPATSGLTINVSPVGYAAASRAKAVQEAGGPWRVGAGLISHASSYIKDLVTDVDTTAGDLLDEARVNAIRKIAGGIRVYGARSVSNDEANWRYISFQDTINYLTREAEQRLEDFVFSTIDGRGGLFGRIESSLVAMLDPVRLAGGLYEAFDSNGDRIDPGYSVQVDDNNNPLAVLATGKVTAEVGVRVSSIGDLITVTLTKSNLTASVV